MDTDPEREPGHVHLHRAAVRDEWQRQRLYLSTFVVSMGDDFPDVLSKELVMSALLQATMMCGIEVSSFDDW